MQHRNTTSTQERPAVRLDFTKGTIKLFFISALPVIAVVALFMLPGLATSRMAYLGFMSLVIMATAMSVALLLTILARSLVKLPARESAVYAFALMMLVTLTVFLGGGFIAHQYGLTDVQGDNDYILMMTQVLTTSAIIYIIILRIVYLKGVEKSAWKASRSANLQALQSRIRPHFMFNSMNSIAGLIRNKPKDAEKALMDLADLIRVLMADARKLVPLTAEIEACEHYLAIEKLRLGDRLEVHWDIEEMPKGCMIPSLTLQPLLENAVYHGIEPNFGGGVIDIHFRHKNNYVYAVIRNPVPEIGDGPHRKGNKIAMQNIRDRLARHYGTQAYLTAETRAGIYGTKLRIPIITTD